MRHPYDPSTLLASACSLALLLGCSSGHPSSPTAPGTGGQGGAGGRSGAGGDAGPGTGAATGTGGALSTGDGSAPPDFWDTSNIPAAKNVMTFKFLNRTNGNFGDDAVFWSFKSGTISEVHSIADQPTYDMPANAAGRMYFYICAAGAPVDCTGDPTKSKYYDFIEHTIGPTQYNGNTTRVDAFGLKIAMRLHCAMGADQTVGEDGATFLEARSATFAKFLAEVPTEFQHLAQPPFAPYRIVEPGAGEFKTGGLYEHYYDGLVSQIWSQNGLTIAQPGPNGSGLGSYPDVSAAIFRHVGDQAGSFSPSGQLANKSLWADATTFYAAAPANYYARFWHTHGLNGKAYGFPYDDVGGYSSYITCQNPRYMLVAIGW
jgi:hypothetical protein